MDKNLCEFSEASGSLEEQSTDKCWVLTDLTATKNLGAYLVRVQPAFTVLLLQGPLGAGKTSLVQGIASEIGIREPITSPTFALAQHYPNGKPPLIHLDLYRLENPLMANELFLQEEEEAQAINAIMAVEWPERLSLSLSEAWLLQIDHHQQGGRIAQLVTPQAKGEDKKSSA